MFKVHKVFYTKNKQSPGPKINDPHLSPRHCPACKCDHFAFGHIFNCNHNDKRHWEFTKTAALIYVANAFINIGTVQKMLYFKIETILFHKRKYKWWRRLWFFNWGNGFFNISRSRKVRVIRYHRPANKVNFVPVGHELPEEQPKDDDWVWGHDQPWQQDWVFQDKEFVFDREERKRRAVQKDGEFFADELHTDVKEFLSRGKTKTEQDWVERDVFVAVGLERANPAANTNDEPKELPRLYTILSSGPLRPAIKRQQRISTANGLTQRRVINIFDKLRQFIHREIHKGRSVVPTPEPTGVLEEAEL